MAERARCNDGFRAPLEIQLAPLSGLPNRSIADVRSQMPQLLRPASLRQSQQFGRRHLPASHMAMYDPANSGGHMDSRTMRRNFVGGLLAGLRVVWPILSGLLGLIVILGLIVGVIERWSVQESIYFAFVSGLTIGYGDL